MTGILIYEDNNNLRESLESLLTLTPGLLLLGSFPRADDIVQQTEHFKPEVILMDIDMPGITGIEAVRKVRILDKKVHIIMITVFNDSKSVLDAICAGASGYLDKKYISDRLPEAIRQVMQGEPPMSSGIARMIITGMQALTSPPADAAAGAADYKLSAREQEILAHLAKGRSLKAMASGLFISIDTVRTHIKRIYEKLQVHTQTEAVAKAINERLV